MAKETSLKITIGNRTYPLKVQSNEEPMLLEAMNQIAEKIKEYESSYAVRDQQDLLAMSCLHFATQYLIQKNQADKVQGNMLDSLKQWNSKLESILK